MVSFVQRTAEASSFGTQSRAHPNLNKIAMAFNQIGATNENRTTQLAAVAGIVNMDRAHVQRLITDRPGFVKVTRLVAGDRSVGYYYMADKFIPVAVSQGFGGYPENLYPLYDTNLPTAISVSDGSVQVGSAPRVEPDIKFPSEVGHYDPVVVEAGKVHATRLRILFERDWQDMAMRTLSEYKYQPRNSVEPLDRMISNLVSLRSWLKENGDDPEATNMLGGIE